MGRWHVPETRAGRSPGAAARGRDEPYSGGKPNLPEGRHAAFAAAGSPGGEPAQGSTGSYNGYRGRAGSPGNFASSGLHGAGDSIRKQADLAEQRAPAQYGTAGRI